MKICSPGSPAVRPLEGVKGQKLVANLEVLLPQFGETVEFEATPAGELLDALRVVKLQGSSVDQLEQRCRGFERRSHGHAGNRVACATDRIHDHLRHSLRGPAHGGRV
jgi:hypothetical protein